MSGASDIAFWVRYGEQFRTHILPDLLKSGYMLAVGEDVEPEQLSINLATELGLMLLLDKPLLVVVPRGVTISTSLRRAAAVVLDDFDLDDPKSHDRVIAAMEQMGVTP